MGSSVMVEFLILSAVSLHSVIQITGDVLGFAFP